MAFGIHLSSEIAPFLVDHVTIFREQCHRLNREGKYALQTFGVEPFHESFLEPTQRFPIGLRAIGEVEVSKQRLKIVAVVVGDVPEHGLVVAGTGRLVERIYDLLEAVGDDLVDGARFERMVDNFIGTFVIVLSVVLGDEIVLMSL